MIATKFIPYSSFSLSSISNNEEFLNDIIQTKIEIFPRKVDKHIILYGAGSLGKMAKQFFNYLEIPFLYVVDINFSQNKTDVFWQNTKIVHPEEVDEIDKKNNLLVICIVTTPLIALRDELKNNGWENIAFFYDLTENYRNQHPLSNGWFVKNFSEKGKALIIKVSSLLADDTSRAHYLQFLAWRKLRIELLFSDLKINNESRFFIPEIINVLREDEVFVDCGAHQGAVTEKFLKFVNNKFKEIIAIEPDKTNFEILETKLRGIIKIKVIKCALSDKNGEERFYQGFDFASRLNENGNDLVKIITLDSLYLRATFIKMHLEGGEFNALKGSINTIQKYRPVLAITIYHNSDGLWKIPVYLMDLLQDYFFYMRSHSWAGTGVVIYAVPRERYIL
jgi:FkbM family methyltransferase